MTQESKTTMPAAYAELGAYYGSRRNEAMAALAETCAKHGAGMTTDARRDLVRFWLSVARDYVYGDADLPLPTLQFGEDVFDSPILLAMAHSCMWAIDALESKTPATLEWLQRVCGCLNSVLRMHKAATEASEAYAALPAPKFAVGHADYARMLADMVQTKTLLTLARASGDAKTAIGGIVCLSRYRDSRKPLRLKYERSKFTSQSSAQKFNAAVISEHGRTLRCAWVQTARALVRDFDISQAAYCYQQALVLFDAKSGVTEASDEGKKGWGDLWIMDHKTLTKEWQEFLNNNKTLWSQEPTDIMYTADELPHSLDATRTLFASTLTGQPSS